MPEKTTTVDSLRISDSYESRAWDQYLEWTAEGRELGVVGRAVAQAGDAAADLGGRVWRRVQGTTTGDTLADVGDRAQQLWTSDRVQQVLATTRETITSGYGMAVETSLQTVDPQRVVRHYADHVPSGAEVAALRDLRLATLDAARPPIGTRHRAQFAASSGATGALQGIATVTGVLSAGAVAADVLASIALSARGIATQLAHYGYDVTRPGEHAYVLTLLQASLAESTLERSLLTNQARSLALGIAQDRTWAELNQNVLTRISRRAFATVGERLTKQRLARLLPGLSGLIGAGQGYRHGRMVMDAAHHEGRARFLRHRWGDPDERIVLDPV